jgi:hypothetical protein
VSTSISIPPYAGNPLIEACGHILAPAEIGRRLVNVPPESKPPSAELSYLLPHLTADLWRLHIPTSTGIEIAKTIDMMIRQGYVHRNPSAPATWHRIYSQIGDEASTSPVQLAALVSGISGTGKSTAIERALQLFPQVVEHASCSMLQGPLKQLVWIKVDVPASGRLIDLVEALSEAADSALDRGVRETIRTHAAKGSTASMLARRWLQGISSHFPGIIVLDEIQNLFKIHLKSVRQQAARKQLGERPTLRIVDDEALKLLLTISNASKIPTLICGTPDGLAALTTRMSTSQRVITAGSYRLPNPASAHDEFYRERFLPALCRYQWFPNKIADTAELRSHIFELTAGIPRICIALWAHAHRHAARRLSDQLTVEDFHAAAAQELAPVRSAVQALLSGDPRSINQYEDLMSQTRADAWAW